MYPDKRTIRTISPSLRGLFFSSCLIAPYALFLAISVTGPKSLFGAQFSLCAGLFITLATAFVYMRKQEPKYVTPVTVAILGLVISELIWINSESLDYMMVLFACLIVLILLRLQILFKSDDLSFYVRRAFRTDSLLIILAIFSLAFAQAGSTAPDYGVMNLYIVIVCIMASVLRIVGMWMLVREITGAQVAPQFSLVILIGSMVGLITTFVKSVFELISVAIVLMVAPFIYRERKMLYVLLGIIGVALLVLTQVTQVIKKPEQPKPQISNSKDLGLRNNIHDWIANVQTSEIRFFIVMTVIFLLLCWIVWRWIRSQNQEHIEQSQVQIVHRVWIRHTRHELRLLPTCHPIRLMYQKWLKEMFHKGMELKPSETPIQFYNRVRENSSEKGEILTIQYQEARYGFGEKDS